MFPRHPEHLRTFDYVGEHRYFLTFCTEGRRRVFTSKSAVDLVSTQISRAAADERVSVIAFCYMPDHVHLLVAGQHPASHALRFITRAKQLSGFHYQKAFHQRLWQRYGYERVMRADEDTFTVARYILENPVRAGLVRHIQEYPFAGSDVFTLEELLESLPWSG